MKDNHYVEYGLNKNCDLKVEIGGMNFHDRIIFIWNIIRFGAVWFVLNKDTVSCMKMVVDGKNPYDKES